MRLHTSTFLIAAVAGNVLLKAFGVSAVSISSGGRLIRTEKNGQKGEDHEEIIEQPQGKHVFVKSQTDDRGNDLKVGGHQAMNAQSQGADEDSTRVDASPSCDGHNRKDMHAEILNGMACKGTCTNPESELVQALGLKEGRCQDAGFIRKVHAVEAHIFASNTSSLGSHGSWQMESSGSQYSQTTKTACNMHHFTNGDQCQSFCTGTEQMNLDSLVMGFRYDQLRTAGGIK